MAHVPRLIQQWTLLAPVWIALVEEPLRRIYTVISTTLKEVRTLVLEHHWRGGRRKERVLYDIHFGGGGEREEEGGGGRREE